MLKQTDMQRHLLFFFLGFNFFRRHFAIRFAAVLCLFAHLVFISRLPIFLPGRPFRSIFNMNLNIFINRLIFFTHNFNWINICRTNLGSFFQFLIAFFSLFLAFRIFLKFFFLMALRLLGFIFFQAVMIQTMIDYTAI